MSIGNWSNKKKIEFQISLANFMKNEQEFVFKASFKPDIVETEDFIDIVEDISKIWGFKKELVMNGGL